MPTTNDTLRRVVEPVVRGLGVELFDLERSGGRVVVTVDRAPDGVDIDTIATVTRAVSRALDDADVISGKYVLEVTSPGLERTLRNPDQYRWAIGKRVTVRLAAPDTTEPGERRCTGTLLAADDEAIDLRVEPGDDVVHLPYTSIQKGRTIVDWDAELKASPSPSSRHRTDAGADHRKVSKR
jgi:ribosome maturation factor RimP